MGDVATAIADKMERRHPHVFGDGGDRHAGWERIKATDRAGSPGGGEALDGVATALPALMRADELGRRAARIASTGPMRPARAKIDEELGEGPDSVFGPASRWT